MDELTKHLDEMVKTIKKLAKLAEAEIDIPEGGTLSFCENLKLGYLGKPYYQTYTGLRKTAELLGLPIEEKRQSDFMGEHIEVSVEYKGVTFLELEDCYED